MDRPASVYAILRDDVIIYVGCSMNPTARLSSHRFARNDRAIRLKILATYSTRASALAGEVCAIASYRARQRDDAGHFV